MMLKKLLILTFTTAMLFSCTLYSNYKAQGTVDSMYLTGLGPQFQFEFVLPKGMSLEVDEVSVTDVGYKIRYDNYQGDPDQYLDIEYTRGHQFSIDEQWHDRQMTFQSYACNKVNYNNTEQDEDSLYYTAALADCHKVLEPFYVVEKIVITSDGMYSMRYYTGTSHTTRYERAEMAIVLAGAKLVPYEMDV